MCGEGVFIHTHTQGKHGKVRRQRARKQSLREREREKFIDKQIDD